ncbi:P-loop containing nucleoside triphosphate hydrolase protein [Xylaria bambusicola]|uniref:P-loop containing nucleoside triphosphate hydrolase protein n=1 Tax=Xylaria bambusicola TaxID=326684 RepID=UPI00200756D9|nr:P-loop containing nucleoside triphosphate hydrolase protein [Xylaria bambusicola]KAI0513070.1 P-loop containing nucleoside triphosphate hydrolase protein [Xylaria bambusicola]
MQSRSRRGETPASTANVRSGTGARMGSRLATSRTSNLRQPMHHAVAAARIDRAAAASPAESLSSVATTGTKRKERDFEVDSAQETNIQVVVRCRGRNKQEQRESSAVVVSTDAVRGSVVDLSMGPSALSNKTYNFDRVFSPAADQSMVYEDVVKPILEEMLSGYNCTIFAYGQTGTGKTYTMSGDMDETFGLLSDEAGIIPRVLHSLFKKLDSEDTESFVKCSFIELYNEELRDLMSVDDNTKLKIFDEVSRKGHATTVVQGMEEAHIRNASEGIKLLQEGSLKRQVAATKCNDLSSRSHTVFTITACVKKAGEDGEDWVSAGKLNLVDLAGSENIQRSGAENKRAAEAGLINKSLLTLGRVINALVDHSSHIPYRESKLTRLLQDSLGGRTKTCIIATVSPAKSNLEETISTLDYAFRAKNIRNKPQVNQMIRKGALLRDLAHEIEKLKSELIATRQRNGVYLSNESYEEMATVSESRRIQNDEQAAKIETLESNLRNKVQELFSLTSSFMGLKKDHEETKLQLEDTKGVLDQTELVLEATRKTLAEETLLRKAHQKTEEQMHVMGNKLIKTLHQTVGHVGGLHAKNKRKSDLQALNRTNWGLAQDQVSEITSLVEARIEEFQSEQQQHISSISERMQTFVEAELEKLSSTQSFLNRNLEVFSSSKKELVEQRQKSKEEMDQVLEEIKEVRDNIKERVDESLRAIATAAETIAEDVLSELGTFHNLLHTSYSALGKDFKAIFEELLNHNAAQRKESDDLRVQLEDATEKISQSNASISIQIQNALDEERKEAGEERRLLLAQITSLIDSQAKAQETRLANRATLIRQNVEDNSTLLGGSVAQYAKGMDSWNAREGKFLDEIATSRETLKSKLQDDWTAANTHSTSIQKTTKSVHAETVRVVDEQIRDLDAQMTSLDDFVTRARSQNSEHDSQHATSLNSLSSTVEDSYANIGQHFQTTCSRVEELGSEMEIDIKAAEEALEPLPANLCQPLADLREDISSTVIREYQPTGDTPQKLTYDYPTELPRTKAHTSLIAKFNGEPSPSKAPVFADTDTTLSENRSPSRPVTSDDSSGLLDRGRSALAVSLRELHPNVNNSNLISTFDQRASTTIHGLANSIGPGSLMEPEDDIPEDMTMPRLSQH